MQRAMKTRHGPSSGLSMAAARNAASAARIHDALAKAGSQSFDAAILDVNVAGERIDPVADLLANRGIPFFFVTGYGRQSMPAAHRQRLAVSKPYQADDLRTALGAVLTE